MRGSAPNKVAFAGSVTAVKARIRLLRSFDQVSHAYLGCTLVLDGAVDGIVVDDLRVAIGPKTHEAHRFRIMDQLRGLAEPVPDPAQEWATPWCPETHPCPKVPSERSHGRSTPTCGVHSALKPV